jgi:expansin
MRSLAVVAMSFALVLAACSGDDGTPSIPNSGGNSGSDTGLDASSGTPPDGTPAADAGAPKPSPADGGTGPLGPEESGEATYYDANGSGACGFKPSTDFMVAAMNDEQYLKADCGKCVAVTGPKGTVVVRIVDKCPGCDRGDLDLSKTAFSKIANLSDGRIKITWHFAACP